MSPSASNLPVVFVFVDTEFTSLERRELIPIGLSASDGTESYGVRTDYRPEHCFGFRAQRGSAKARDLACATQSEGAGGPSQEWLAAKARIQLPVLAYDYMWLELGDAHPIQAVNEGRIEAVLEQAVAFAREQL